MPVLTSHPRISADPNIMLGKPVIAGTRVPVQAIVRQFAAGADMAWVLESFPDIDEDDVRAALAYAAERVVDLASVSAG